MIRADHLSFSYGEKPIFVASSFMIGINHKVGLVGPNGAGKSTLFNLLMNRELPDAGTIDVSGIIEMVPQEVKRDPNLEYSRSIREYLNCGVNHPDYELRRILDGLEMEQLGLDSKPSQFSGGQKTKLAIARALLLEPDILLLDEPTNFLDVSGKKWVMKFLSQYPKTVLLVSHDLQLMNQAIDKVLSINTQTHQIEEYTGNYTAYLRMKKERDEMMKRQIMNEHKKITRMKESLTKMARFTSKKGVRQRTMLKRRIERIEATLPDLPQEVKKIKLTLPPPSHVGEVPLMIKNLAKQYGDLSVLESVSLTVKRGERIALLGANGAGKSTLIKIIMGLVSADSGEVIKDDRLSIGYYSQEFESLPMDLSLIDYLQEKAEIPEPLARTVLGKFMFSGQKVYQRVLSLSGGEKTRLSMALLLLHQHNLLILDEPTTFLDVLSQRVILDALKAYQGTMLVVSHTPEFISELEPSRALLLPEEKVVFWEPELVERVSEV